MFYRELKKHGSKVALIECETGEEITYEELDSKSSKIAELLKFNKELIFISLTNSIKSITYYLGALKANKVIYLVDDLNSEKTSNLIDLYQPNYLIDASGEIKSCSSFCHNLHEDLSLLLSTSGSTGTPKFVKLSSKNINNNAISIASYLGLNNQERALAHLKLHYSYGLSVLNSHFSVGASLALTNTSIMDDEFWNHLSKYKATSFAGVPYTFEALLQQNFDLSKYPSLNMVTQAGGKLEPDIVKYYVNLGNKLKFDFIVMYGQTEAAPRISYLPPNLAQEFPHTIGKAIPGGELYLINEHGDKIQELDQPGELVYEGDNIMMGYATDIAELSSDNTPKALLTGDIACKTQNELFYIVGRSKRFVKLFGNRINLDDVQSYVKTFYAKSAVTGNDEMIIIALEADATNDVELISNLSAKYKLPNKVFLIKKFDNLPLLTSGKYDYKFILEHQTTKENSIFTKLYDGVLDILGLNTNSWDSISSLFESSLQYDSIDDSLCYDDLDTDSISFVFLSVELEECLGDKLPKNWQQIPVRKLDNLFQKLKYS